MHYFFSPDKILTHPVNSSSTGIYAIAEKIQRPIPVKINDVTHETIHPSVLCQKNVHPEIIQVVRDCPQLIWSLHPHEEVVREHWRIMRAPTDSAPKHTSNPMKELEHLLHTVKSDITGALTHKDKDKSSHDPDGLAKFSEEHSMGSIVKELMSDRH